MGPTSHPSLSRMWCSQLNCIQHRQNKEGITATSSCTVLWRQWSLGYSMCKINWHALSIMSKHGITITSRNNYCNSFFSRVAVTHLRPLSTVLNAAVRLIVKELKYDPITTTIRVVPNQQRIEYKLCDLVYKAMYHTAPVYLTELCSCVNTPRSC